MKITRNNATYGFTDIYFTGDPDPEGQPDKQPYLVLELPLTYTNGTYLETSKIDSLLKLGNTVQKNGISKITITSNRKVISAIDIILDDPNYAADDVLIKKLLVYKRLCEKDQNKKIMKRSPATKQLTDFFPKLYSKTKINPSFNSVKIMLKNSQVNGKEYVFKKYATDRTLSEIEVFNAYCYKLLLGVRHPKKTRSIVDIDGKRLGVMSEVIPGFVSVNEYYLNNQRKAADKDFLVKSEIIKVWVAAYCEEETDLHSGNYGFDKYQFAVKIDNDRSSWPLTSKYMGVDPSVGSKKFIDAYKTPPKSDFKVTLSDIINFPYLKDAKPARWFDMPNSGYPFFTEPVMKELVKDKKFNDDKYFVFLKRILIDKSVYSGIAAETISSSKMQLKHATHKDNRTAEIEKVLMQDPGFSQYLFDNPLVINKILQEFGEYNQEFSKSKHAHLRVNLDSVRDKYFHVLGELCMNQMKILPIIIEELCRQDKDLLEYIVNLPDNNKFKSALLLSSQFDLLVLKLLDISRLKSLQGTLLSMRQLYSIITYFEDKLVRQGQLFFSKNAQPEVMTQLKKMYNDTVLTKKLPRNDELPEKYVVTLVVIIDDYQRNKHKYDPSVLPLLDSMVETLNTTIGIKLYSQSVKFKSTPTFADFMKKVIHEYSSYSQVMNNQDESQLRHVGSAADFIWERYAKESILPDKTYAPSGGLNRNLLEKYLIDELKYSKSRPRANMGK